MKLFIFIFLFPLLSMAYPEDLIRIRREVEDASILYFIDHAHPVTGLVRDKAKNFSLTEESNKVSSLAATGFGLAVIAHAAREGKINFADAEEQTLRTLRFVYSSVPHYRGWLLHFVDWRTGARVWNSEYSTIDTALFLAGAMYATRIFSNAEISELTRKIYERVDFHSAMTDDGQRPMKRTLSLSYTPEKGWTTYQWETYAEQMILIILGLGHPTRPLPVECWHTWRRGPMGIHMPLFVHQYSHLFIDFRMFKEKIWDAGFQATFLQRNLRRDGFWGLSAGESPEGYLVSSPVSFKGTICIGCALGSAMYAPEVVMKDVLNWKEGNFGTKLWGKYGLTDSIDIKRNWFSPYVLGITKGPEYLSVQNMEGRTAIWNEFMIVPEIQRAVGRIR